MSPCAAAAREHRRAYAPHPPMLVGAMRVVLQDCSCPARIILPAGLTRPFFSFSELRLVGAGAHGVVVSHPLCMRKALGSNPSGSTVAVLFLVVYVKPTCKTKLFTHARQKHNAMHGTHSSRPHTHTHTRALARTRAHARAQTSARTHTHTHTRAHFFPS